MAPVASAALPPAHAVDAVMTAIGAIGTTSTSTTAVTVIHDQVIGAPRWSIWQYRRREMAQVAPPVSSRNDQQDGLAGAPGRGAPQGKADD